MRHETDSIFEVIDEFLGPHESYSIETTTPESTALQPNYTDDETSKFDLPKNGIDTILLSKPNPQ